MFVFEYQCSYIHCFVVACWQETLGHLSKFVRGSTTERSGCVDELVKSALQLLQSLPATRSAILQYITDIYDDAVNQHLEQRKYALCAYISMVRTIPNKPPNAQYLIVLASSCDIPVPVPVCEY